MTQFQYGTASLDDFLKTLDTTGIIIVLDVLLFTWAMFSAFGQDTA